MVNKVILVGNVGADPEVRTFESGTKTAQLNLATSEHIFNRKTNQTNIHTEWHTITFWAGQADIVDKYVRKGSQIYVEGRLRAHEWVDKENIRHYSTVIIAKEVKLLGRRSDNETTVQHPQTESSAATTFTIPTIAPEDADDLPF